MPGSAAQLALDLPARTRQMTDAADLLPRPVRTTFRFLEVAEDELSAASLPRPLERRVFWASLPSALLREKGEHLYRSHVRELVARARAGEDLRPGTDAECL